MRMDSMPLSIKLTLTVSSARAKGTALMSTVTIIRGPSRTPIDHKPMDLTMRTSSVSRSSHSARPYEMP
jgi:hypothetical protein